jgi:hypothetical protein
VDVERFTQIRPYLYHVTARENLAAIARARRLHTAAELMQRAGRTDLLRWQRRQPIQLVIDDDRAVLTGQAALIEERISLRHGWSFGDFIEYLNEHVFFWPGSPEGPAKSGVLSHDELAGAALLRVPAADLFEINAEPLFCAVNVRAPRGQDARRTPRGPHLFTPAAEFTRREAEVIEVGFRSGVDLPATTQVREHEIWRAL